jgi:mono/diheme cytochrome c family protein
MPRFLPFPTALAAGAALLAVPSPAFPAPARQPGVDTSALPAPLARPVNFFRDVHPLLAEHCVSCHGPDKQKGGLRLDSRAAALAGGSSAGPAIVPGRGADSPLVQFTAHLVPDLEMPPDQEPLPDDRIALLRAWIDQGAKWPSPQEADAGDVSTLGNQPLFFERARTHWAFQPVPDAPVPDALSRRIDDLVAAKLAERGLRPSPPAAPRVLARRLHLDLTGLPPDPETVEAFAADPSPSAYAALVDRLLASPRFGERWARHWLDIARYADTRDWQAQQDLRYPFAWTYRDYVIDAFRTDKPYDRFLREQLAADLLGLPGDAPELAALGFLTVGPRFRNNQTEQLNDRIDVATRGLMALTVVCARCHDHKYDPIRAADFYALYGVFASTEDQTELPEIALPAAMPDAAALRDYESAIGKARQSLADFVEGLKQKAVADILAQPALYFDALRQMEIAKTADVRKLITGKKMTETALTPLGQAWNDLKRSPKWLNHPVLGPLARVAGASPDRKAMFLERMIASGRLPGGDVAIQERVLAALREKKPADESALLALYADLLAAVSGTPDAPDRREFLAAFSGPGGWLDFPAKSVEGAHRLLGSGRADLNKLYTAIAEVEATHPGAPPRAMAVRDRDTPVQPVVFLRGDPANKGDRVDRRFLEVLAPEKTAFAEGSGRLELAERIASADNPLTSRVWANHVWRHLLGRGLVKTPGDFGLQADPPSHPELLDLLAAALTQRGWSTKRLIRDIVLSDTYRQSSAERPEGTAADPENSLLWRAHRRRMDFEAMRDSMLAASGQLDLTEGGRPVDLSAEPFPARRTIYGHIDRANLDPLFTTFDFPSPDVSSPERPQTMVPQQALFALNDGFIVAQARALAAAARSATGNSADPAPAVAWLHRRVFLRPPTPQEAGLAADFFSEAARAKVQASFGSWAYGYGPSEPGLPARARFTPLAHFDPAAGRYQGGRVYPHPQLGHVSLSAVGGHPGNRTDKAAIRRWMPPRDGEIAVSGELVVSRPERSDGVRASVLDASGTLLGAWESGTAAVETNLARIPVTRGEPVDFVVDCKGTGSADAFRWAPTIRYLDAAAAAPPAPAPALWDAQADFTPPPPPPLAPLEQLAHALLMTNEFLFVD